MTVFELEERESPGPGVRVVEVSGELDLTNAPALETRLRALAGQDGVLVLDLNRVLFVDSAALHTLFRTARHLGPERFGLVLEPTAAIAATLEIVELPRLVAIGSTLAELLEALGAGR